MYVSLCAIVVGVWAFKTIDEQEKSLEAWDDDDFPTENENEQGNLLWWFWGTQNDMGHVNNVDNGQEEKVILNDG